ncbi:MAG TPA: hypothetical protein VKK30_08005 [Actinomycetota bacterium]|nr:hypothetical protein [Actinomycetota bacterium]
MRADFYRPDAPEKVVATASWSGSGVRIDADDEEVRAAVRRIFRPTAVSVDDPALRSFGTSGPTQLQPGSLRWFHEAVLSRAGEEGLAVRLVPEAEPTVGFDPAGLYRPFDEQWDRTLREQSAKPEPPEEAVVPQR